MNMATRKTAKATEYYFGNDTFGRGVALARRESDGQYFVRFCSGPRGYGRWGKHNETVTHPTETTNIYTGEVIQFSEETSKSLVNWGFQRLQSADPKGIRLPLE
jgi:hypothetical protein